MMKKTNKKRGFTIIELTIVVAVIAILSAVLIPTFAAIIKKSRESADQQAVRSMNTVLGAAILEDDATIYDVYDALTESGIDADNYKPLYKDRFFFYDSKVKQVVYTDSTYKVLYPENLVTDKANWITLSGEIAKANISDIEITGGTKAEVDTAEELATLMQSIREGTENKTKNVKEVVLAADTTYNLMGADISIKEVTAKNSTTEAFKIDGNGATLAGVVNGTPAREDSTNNADKALRNYSAGLIGKVAKGTVTISDITIDNAVFGDNNINFVGLVGTVSTSATVTFDNVKVTNSTFKGMDKIGAFVGYVTGNVIIEDTCSVSATTVECTKGNAGGIFGFLQKGSVKVADPSQISVNVKLDKVAEGYYMSSGKAIDANLLDNTITLDMDKNFAIEPARADGDYDYAATCAKYGFLKNGGTAKIEGLTGYNGKGVWLKYNATAATLPAEKTDGYYVFAPLA